MSSLPPEGGPLVPGGPRTFDILRRALSERLENAMEWSESRACCAVLPQEETDPQEVQRLAQIGKALGHPVRAKILLLLSRQGGQLCVCDLERQFDLSQPTISHHLRVLRQAGLIESRQRGPWIYYLIRPEPLDWLRGRMDAWLEQAAAQAETET